MRGEECWGERASSPLPVGAEDWMRQALVQAELALASADVPIGAVVVDGSGRVVGRGYNRREADRDPTAHAEVLAIREAARVMGSWRLEGCTLVVTVEPCMMCAGSLILARIPRLIFGAWEEKTGAVGGRYDLVRQMNPAGWVEVYPGVLEKESVRLLRDFFRQRRS